MPPVENTVAGISSLLRDVNQNEDNEIRVTMIQSSSMAQDAWERVHLRFGFVRSRSVPMA